MNILVNGKTISIDSESIYSLKERLYPNSDIIVLNGFQTNVDTPIKENDTINYIKKGVMPPLDELEAMISSRHTPKVYNKLKSATVKIQTMDIVTSYLVNILARLGVGKIIIPNDTVVSKDDITVGDFNPTQLGLSHLEAIKDTVARINPFVTVTDNLSDYDILVCKQGIIINTDNKTIYYNYGNNAIDISTKEISGNKYLCGCKNPVDSVTATYAMVVAGHIGNLILNLSL